MQQFTVPQFIDVEDKIIGPVTSRQFVILLAVAMLIAINYKILDFSGFLVISVPEFAIALVLAFIKVNGRPFHFFILNIVQTFRRSSLRVWNNSYNYVEINLDREPGAKVKPEDRPITVKATPYQTSRLEELSLIVDTQGAYKGEDNKLEK